MTILILKDYVLMEQFVTGKVYTVCLRTVYDPTPHPHPRVSLPWLICSCVCGSLNVESLI